MKRIILVLLLAPLLQFAKAATKSESLSATSVFKQYIVVTQQLQKSCPDGSTIITGYIYIVLDADTGQVVSTSFANTGQTCTSNSNPES